MVIQPAEVPSEIGVAVVDVTLPGHLAPFKRVMLQVMDTTGVHITFMDPDAAVRVAAMLKDAARTAKSGIIVANGHETP